MEGTQTVKKRRKGPALVAILAAAAFFCGGRTALAQFIQVTPNGVGDLLVYQYWTTQNRDTLFAIINPFGPVQVALTGGEDTEISRFVHIRIREGVASREVLNFTICLSPGDVWTAAIAPGASAGTSRLIVGNRGSCDEQVGVFGFTQPPLEGQPVGINADFGYIEAYTMECTRTFIPGQNLNCPIELGNNNGGDDSIMGVATPLNAEIGFASSYNATALVGFDAFNESASLTSPNGTGTVNNVGTASAVARAIAREGGVDKEVLFARWTAAPEINSSTQLVLTFPGNFQPGAGNPVSIWIWDEEENFNFSPREIFLPWEVNICTLENGLNTTTGNTQFNCNGDNTVLPGEGGNDVLGPGGTFTGGWLRIIDNNDRIPFGPGAGGDWIGDGTGLEFDNLDAPPDSRFAVLGLAFSFLSGTLGDFDQAYPIHWASIIGVGGIGGAVCRPGVLFNPGFPAGCRSFNIPSTFAPWFRPPTLPSTLVIPGNNDAGALNLAGSTTGTDAL